MAWSIEKRFEHEGVLHALWRSKDAEGRPVWVVNSYDYEKRCWREPPPGVGLASREAALEAVGLPKSLLNVERGEV